MTRPRHRRDSWPCTSRAARLINQGSGRREARDSPPDEGAGRGGGRGVDLADWRRISGRGGGRATVVTRRQAKHCNHAPPSVPRRRAARTGGNVDSVREEDAALAGQGAVGVARQGNASAKRLTRILFGQRDVAQAGKAGRALSEHPEEVADVVERIRNSGWARLVATQCDNAMRERVLTVADRSV
jgi:hypothetical protein